VNCLDFRDDQSYCFNVPKEPIANSSLLTYSQLFWRLQYFIGARWTVCLRLEKYQAL